MSNADNHEISPALEWIFAIFAVVLVFGALALGWLGQDLCNYLVRLLFKH